MFTIMSKIDKQHEPIVPKYWNPPMTSNGQEIRAAMEIEHICRGLWKGYAPPKPPPFRTPGPSEDPVEWRRLEDARVDELEQRRRQLRRAITSIAESDDAFSLLPPATHESLRRLRELALSIPGVR